MDIQQLSFLVVEDHAFQRETLVQMLKDLRAKTVHAAPDGRAGLQLLKTLPAAVDIVISDLDMPTMDGIEFIRHLGLAWKGVSLIVASALERELLSSVETMAIAYGIEFLDTIKKTGHAAGVATGNREASSHWAACRGVNGRYGVVYSRRNSGRN